MPFLKYKGQSKNLTLDMAWFLGGPYFIEGPEAVVEVAPGDVELLVRRNPLMFEEVDPPQAPSPPPVPGFICPECDKEYKTELGLTRHIDFAHPKDDE